MFKQLACIVLATVSVVPIVLLAAALQFGSIELAIDDAVFQLSSWVVYTLIAPLLSVLLFWALLSRNRPRHVTFRQAAVSMPDDGFQTQTDLVVEAAGSEVPDNCIVLTLAEYNEIVTAKKVPSPTMPVIPKVLEEGDQFAVFGDSSEFVAGDDPDVKRFIHGTTSISE